jgi:hypothetical protein
MILLPVAFFCASFLVFLGSSWEEQGCDHDWRLSFLKASLLWGILVVISSEFFSIIQSLTRDYLTVFWLLALLIILFIGQRTKTMDDGFRHARKVFYSLATNPSKIIISLITILVLILLVAVISPSNNGDSIQYHMPRVRHWAQNWSLAHYPTAYKAQLWNPIWAEISILQLRLLWGSDRLANLVQYFSFLSSMIGVSYIAKLLGANNRGQLLSAVFVVSIPMAILQATSTQTDLVTGYWYVCLIAFILLGKMRPYSRSDYSFIAISLGLGMLTKGTFYPYAITLLVWLAYLEVRMQGWVKAIFHGATVALVVSAINLGFWYRNIQAFGGFLGSSDWMNNKIGESFRLSGVVSRIVRHIFLNFPTPWEVINASMENGISKFEVLLGYTFDKIDLLWLWNHDDIAGSPVHFILSIIALLCCLLNTRLKNNRNLFQYAAVVFISFAIFAGSVNYDPFGVRYQLPFLLLSAPVFGVLLTHLKWKNRDWLLGLFLLISLPWIFFNISRPIIAFQEISKPFSLPCTDTLGCTRSGSILFEDQTAILFANYSGHQDEYELLTEVILSSYCSKIGLRLDSHDPEYLWWWLLDTPQKDIEIRYVYFSESLSSLADPEFEPCAIICTICGDRTTLHGLSFEGNYGDAKLFLGGQYSADKDG